MKKSPALLSLPLAAALALSACGSGAADDGKPTVAASFYPFAFVVQEVGGDLVSVDNLTQPGGEPHDLELSPKQVAEVQDADLVVYQHEFQAAVDAAVDQADREAGTTVDVADLVTELDSAEGGELDATEEEGHEDEAHEEEGHDHDHGAHDPHTWLDPTNMIAVTNAVADALGQVDPGHATEYAANAERLVGELEDLDGEFTAGLQTCERREIVTSHAAFAYLAARYDLHQDAISGLDPSDEPKPSQLAAITDLVKSEGITTIFTEELVSPAIAETVARETGATTAVLDPIEGLSDATSDETYLTLMRANLDAIRQANSCQ